MTHTHHHPQDYPMACLRLFGTITHAQAKDIARAFHISDGLADPDHWGRSMNTWRCFYDHLDAGLDTYWFPNHHVFSDGSDAPGHVRTRNGKPHANLPRWVFAALELHASAWSWRSKNTATTDHLTWTLVASDAPRGLVTGQFLHNRLDPSRMIHDATTPPDHAWSVLQKAQAARSTLCVADSAHEALAKQHALHHT